MSGRPSPSMSAMRIAGRRARAQIAVLDRRRCLERPSQPGGNARERTTLRNSPPSLCKTRSERPSPSMSPTAMASKALASIWVLLNIVVGAVVTTLTLDAPGPPANARSRAPSPSMSPGATSPKVPPVMKGPAPGALSERCPVPSLKNLVKRPEAWTPPNGPAPKIATRSGLPSPVRSPTANARMGSLVLVTVVDRSEKVPLPSFENTATVSVCGGCAGA